MLHLILGNDDRAFACGEVVNRYRPVKTHHYLPRCACGRQPCPTWSLLNGVPARSFYAAAFDALDVDVIVDSSKEASWLIDARRWTAKSEDIATVNIFSYKSPIDLSYSFWKRGHDVMFWRKEFLRYYGRIFGVGLPTLTVNLDELVEDPEGKVRQICSVLGQTYVAGRERFWERDHHHLFGNYGVRRQVQTGRSVFEPRRGYPEEFAVNETRLREAIETDVEVQALLAILRAAEVKNAAPSSATLQRFDLARPYAAWYYRQRLKRLWFGRFPRSIDDGVRNAAATVPLDGRDTSA
jgi:hypothetical protein